MKHQKLIMRLIFVVALLTMTAQTAWADDVSITTDGSRELYGTERRRADRFDLRHGDDCRRCKDYA